MSQGTWGLVLLLFACAAQSGEAVEMRAGTLGGLMVQPTSSYYHAVYGAYGEVASQGGGLLARAGYLERPLFKAAGFSDQEFFGFGLIGARVFGKGWHGLQAFVGGGQTTGYVRADSGLLPSRHYRVPGLVCAAEYYVRWKKLDAAFEHQVFVGHVNDHQLRAYVAWPYSFVLLRAGIVL